MKTNLLVDYVLNSNSGALINYLLDNCMNNTTELEQLAEGKNLLVEIKNLLASHNIQMLGPEWMWGWILEHPSQSPREHHEAVWISVNLELMIVEFVERANGKTSTAEYSLYDSDCFDKLIADMQSSELIKMLEGRTGRASGAVC